MKIYWSLKSIPELKDLPKEERKMILKESYYQSLKHWQTWAVAFAINILFIMLFMFISNYLSFNLWKMFLMIGIGGGIGGFIWGIIS